MKNRAIAVKVVCMTDGHFDLTFIDNQEDLDKARVDCALLDAAPDLLAALEEMAAQHYCGCNHPACWSCKRDEMCKQAIAKAKGEIK